MKKVIRILSLAMTLFMFFSMLPCEDWNTRAEVSEYNDVLMLQDYIAGKHVLAESELIYFDINADGKVNIFDLALLKKNLKYTDAKILINEVCASNKGSLIDSLGNTPDWVEIFNNSDSDVDISGWGLSDNASDMFKYTFPENTIISCGGYILVYCDGISADNNGEYHAPFKLSAQGETVYLTVPEYGCVDSVQFAASENDVTWGRYRNGTDSFSWLTPTPGKSNDLAEKIVNVEPPEFSVESGFYDSSFELEITSGEGTTILYTLDGSDPAVSETAMIYEDVLNIYDNTSDPNILSEITDITLSSYTPPPFDVDKGIVVRACAKDSYGNVSDSVVKSYYIGKSAGYYDDMKVISIVTDSGNLFDGDTGIYVVGNAYYQWLESDEYKVLSAWSTENPTNFYQSGREWERPAAVEIFENGSLVYENNVGIRIAGNSSRHANQKSFRLYARSEYGESKLKYAFFDDVEDADGNAITSFDKITLRNGGTDYYTLRMRDKLIQGLCSDRAVSVQASESCIVFINGEFWGYYSIREFMDDEYIESHYGVDKNNVTILKNGEVEGSAEIYDQYIDFFDWAVNADMSMEENYQRVCSTIDVQSLMDYIAIETYVCNWDWSNVNFTSNWQMWRSNTVNDLNTYEDGRWRFMLYDTDNSSGLNQSTKPSGASDNRLAKMNQEKEWVNIAALFYKLMENQAFKEQFYMTYIEIMDNNFAVERVDEEIDMYVSEMKEAVLDTNMRFRSSSGFDETEYDKQIQILRDFYHSRPEYALRYLEEFCSE